MGDKKAPLTRKEIDLLQSKIGQILWIARQSRPDVIFDASNLASFLKKANIEALNEANKIIKDLRSETVTLKLKNSEVHKEDILLCLLVKMDSSPLSVKKNKKSSKKHSCSRNTGSGRCY